jgi:probable F420-dependent oxidoreductase
MGTPTQVGLFFSHANQIVGNDLERLLEVAVAIDEAGIDYLTVADHVLLGAEQDGYADVSGRASLGYPLDEPYPDPLILLAAVAGVTTRVRLATGVLIVPLRPAVVVAKMAATLDAVSRGRLDLGVGVGWHEAEFAATDVPLERRGARMEDTIRACQALWAGGPATFESDTVSFSDVYSYPRPAHGTVPVWFGGRHGPATVRRLTELGSGWQSIAPTPPETLRAIRADLARSCESTGRSPGDIGIRTPVSVRRTSTGELDLPAMAAQVAELGDAGATGVHMSLRDLSTDPGRLRDELGQLGSLSTRDS